MVVPFKTDIGTSFGTLVQEMLAHTVSISWNPTDLMAASARTMCQQGRGGVSSTKLPLLSLRSPKPCFPITYLSGVLTELTLAFRSAINPLLLSSTIVTLLDLNRNLAVRSLSDIGSQMKRARPVAARNNQTFHRHFGQRIDKLHSSCQLSGDFS